MNTSQKIRLYYMRKIKDFFDPLMEANEGHLFNWDIIFKALKHFRSFSWRTSDFCRVFFNRVLQLFEHYKCRDKNILANILVEYCLNDNTLWASVGNNSENIIERTSGVHILKLMKLDYGEARTFRKYTAMDPIGIALNSTDENVLDFLIRQGVAYLPLIDDYLDWNYLNDCLRWLGEPEFLKFTNGQALHLKISKYYKGSEARRRLLIVLKGLEILPFQLTERYDKWPRCLQKIFQTIPEPHVTSQEFREFLHRVSNCDAGKVIEELSREYESIFPESCKAKQPRSLFHLSRCQVRQNLRTAGTFPHGVNQLNLPKQLEKSVLLQNCLTYKPYLN